MAFGRGFERHFLWGSPMTEHKLPVGKKIATIQSLIEHVEECGGSCKPLKLLVDDIEIPHIEFSPPAGGRGIKCVIAGNPEDRLAQSVILAVKRKLQLF